MPKLLLKRWHGLHAVLGLIFLVILSVVLCVYEWPIGAAAFVLTCVYAVYAFLAEKAFRRDLNNSAPYPIG